MQPAASFVSYYKHKKDFLKSKCMSRTSARDSRKHLQNFWESTNKTRFLPEGSAWRISPAQEEVAAGCCSQNCESRVNHAPEVTRHYAVV